MMSEPERYVARCLRGHETVVTTDTIRPMLDVNKRGTTFVIRCPHIEDGVVCGAPAQIAQKEIARLLGLEPGEVKQMMKDMHARKMGTGPVAPLQPPEPVEPLGDEDEDDSGGESGGWQDALKSPASPRQSVPPRPVRRPVQDDDGSDDFSAHVRTERPKLERKYPPIRVVEKKDPIEVLKEVINESGLKDDVTYTLHRIADLMDDGWSTEDFVMIAKQYGVSDAVAKGVAMRFKLEWKSHLKQLEQQQQILDRASGPALGPFTREPIPGANDPLISAQRQQLAQQIGMQMLQGNPMMQVWAQSNPRDFEAMIVKIVEQTLKSQQSQAPQQPAPGFNPAMGGMAGMNPMMAGQVFPYGVQNPMMNPMMNSMMNPMMGPMMNPSPFSTPPPSHRETVSEEKIAGIVDQKVSAAMNEIKMTLAQIGAQQRPQEDPLLKQIVLNMLQQQNQAKEVDPMVTMLLQHVLESNSGRGDAIEAMLAQLLQETKKGLDSRSLDLDHLREMINLKSIEGELSLKQREFDDRRESRDLMREALNEGLTIVGQAFASTMMSRGMGGAPVNTQHQQPVQTEMLQTDDGNIVMRCRACNELIMAPPDAVEVICPFCNAQFPVVDAPVFKDQNQDQKPTHEEPPGRPPADAEDEPDSPRAQPRTRGRGVKTLKKEAAEETG
jgi:hypothetical protein